MQGTRIGDYVVEAKLGGGGMATVWRATHHILETTHALKILDERLRMMPQARARFLDEARIQAQHLDHANIVKVTNIVATDEAAALVMELIEGPTLGEYIEQLRKPPTADEFRAIALPILAAVQHAHDHGIIHRDLKPDNVLLATERGTLVPHVTDFGVAKVGDAAAEALGKKDATEMDAAMGTVGYMSPEQIRRAKSVTERSDVFSLGALLYELATLRKAYDAPNDFDIKSKICNGVFEPPEQVVRGLDPSIAAAINKALEPDSAKRFASCNEMASAFRGDSDAVPEIAARPSKASNKSRAGILVLVAAVVVAAVAAGVFFLKKDGGATATTDAGITIGIGVPIDAGVVAPRSRALQDMDRQISLWFWSEAIAIYRQTHGNGPVPVGDKLAYDRAVQRLIEERRTELQVMYVHHQCVEAGVLADAVMEELPQYRDELSDVAITCFNSKSGDAPVLPYVVYFGSGDSALEARHSAWLDRLIEIIGKRSGQVRVVGYVGQSEGRGYDLALERARTVHSYLIRKGIPEERLALSSRLNEGSSTDTWSSYRVELHPVH